MSMPSYRDRQKSTIVKIARDILATEGLEGLQARRVAGAADCSVGTIYNLFGSLDMVIIAANAERLVNFTNCCFRRKKANRSSVANWTHWPKPTLNLPWPGHWNGVRFSSTASRPKPACQNGIGYRKRSFSRSLKNFCSLPFKLRPHELRPHGHCFRQCTGLYQSLSIRN
jgi:hypothetical protein